MHQRYEREEVLVEFGIGFVVVGYISYSYLHKEFLLWLSLLSLLRSLHLPSL